VKPTLQPGISHTHRFTVTGAKTVPALFPEAASFQAMPAVFATGYMTGLFEWAFVELLAPYLDEGEGSLGVMVNFTHEAATPPGLTVTVEARCTKVEGRSVEFEITAHDGLDRIGGGTHRRAVVVWDRFVPRMAAKLEKARGQGLVTE
jgi:fluoroacetyl-CoA thioesterase